MKEMSVRNSISATNAQVLLNGKSGLLNERTVGKDDNGEEQNKQ